LETYTLGDANTLLEDGQLKHIELDEDEAIVLARRNDTYYAFSPTCTHYGAPLHKGILHNHTLVCPWHHACFDIRTGMREEPPALDPVASYPVHVKDGQVIVELSPQTDPSPPSVDADETIMIVGGGAAGEAAIEELRRNGFAGKIMLMSATDSLPIDRPNVSKDYLAGDAKAEWMPLRDQSWYEEQDIDLNLGTRIEQIDTQNQKAMTDDGRTLHYDKLLLAPGSDPITLDNLPGSDLDNVFTLRTQADADQIIAQVEDAQNIVIVGGSFIGMEAASSLGQRGLNVTVIDQVKTPFEAVLGQKIGAHLQQLHEENDVQFKLETSAKAFYGDDGTVTAVELTDGTKLPADLVILGVGVKPATAFLSESQLKLSDDDGAVLVDQYLQTSVPGIYAAGDIARFPYHNHGAIRIEHWRLAQQHGFIAARNMLGVAADVNDHVPFFWTGQWGTKLRYLGYAAEWDEIIYRGDVDAGEFVAFYMADGQLIAAAGINRDVEMSALEFVLKHKLPLTKDDMQNPDFDIVAQVRYDKVEAR